jgi:hypothetical protein
MRRLGALETPRCFQIFGVRTDPRWPGFYQIAQMECHGTGRDDDDGSGSWCEPEGGRPVRGDFVKEFFQDFMRFPNCFDQIEWGEDRPFRDWPFPSPLPRWPAWKRGEAKEARSFLHRIDSEIEHGGDFFQRLVEHVLEDHYAALHGRKLCEPRHRCFDRLPPHHHLHGI